MNTSHLRRSLVPAILFSLIVPGNSAAQPQELDRQVIFMTKPGIISLGIGQISGRVEEITIEADLREALLTAGVDRVVRALPQFSKSDTLRILPDGRIYKRADYTNYLWVEVPLGANPDSLVAWLNRLPSIEYAHIRSIRIFPSANELEPNDDDFGNQWNMKNEGQSEGTEGADVKATYAWYRTTGSSSLKIAIVDWGIRDTHNDFSDRIEGDEGYTLPHGTWVAGVAAATGNNEIGIAGMDWKATVVSELLPDPGEVKVDSIVAAIQSAVESGARVINCSWGVDKFNWSLNYSFLQAYAADVMLVTSGPEEDVPLDWPSSNGSFIHTVTASNHNDDPANYVLSNPFTDLAAPGGEGSGDGRIYTTDSDNNDDYAWVPGGTSVAAPHSTGLASLMLALNPNLHNYDIEWLQKLTADGKGDHSFQIWGYGRLNANNATKGLRTNKRACQSPSYNILD